jgi:hypothetical protein
VEYGSWKNCNYIADGKTLGKVECERDGRISYSVDCEMDPGFYDPKIDCGNDKKYRRAYMCEF